MELFELIEKAHQFNLQGKKTVIATIIGLKGSSYRKPGTRMLLTEAGDMTFALSGGCIEKDVFMRSRSVFLSNTSKVIFYNGTDRLGCEGILTILIEPVEINKDRYDAFRSIASAIDQYTATCYYQNEDGAQGDFGTIFSTTDGGTFTFRSFIINESDRNSLDHCTFRNKPKLKIFIAGGGHGVNSMLKFVSNLGWETHIVLCPETPKSRADFPSADYVHRLTGEELALYAEEKNAVFVIMTHNYNKDLDFVQHLLRHDPSYIGIVGSKKRKAKLFSDLEELGIQPTRKPNISTPAGLDIGAETPDQISISIIAEIMAVLNQKPANFLGTMKNETSFGFQIASTS
jgi:xanthine/CO dehydrogenase XdhC/CoxF family maturation factor